MEQDIFNKDKCDIIYLGCDDPFDVISISTGDDNDADIEKEYEIITPMNTSRFNNDSVVNFVDKKINQQNQEKEDEIFSNFQNNGNNNTIMNQKYTYLVSKKNKEYVNKKMKYFHGFSNNNNHQLKQPFKTHNNINNII